MEVHTEHRPEPRPEPRKVAVTVDNERKKVWPGTYIVSQFKKKVGVPAEKELDQVINGVLTLLDDKQKITIAGGEVFVSHPRTGQAS